jgi:hypothetical protein
VKLLALLQLGAWVAGAHAGVTSGIGAAPMNAASSALGVLLRETGTGRLVSLKSSIALLFSVL